MKTITKIGITLLAILAVFMLLGCAGNSTNNSENTAQDTAKSTPTETQESTPTPTPTKTEVKADPVTIATFSGSSTKDTETFSVPSKEWKISWDTKAGKFEGNFIFTVNNADGTFKAPGANVIGTNSESTIVRGAGDYYLSITATQPYTIKVETL